MPNGTWIGGPGNWSDPTKWVDGIVASGAGSSATFPSYIGGSVNLDLDVTIGQVIGSTPGRMLISSTTNKILTLSGSPTVSNIDFDVTLAGTEGVTVDRQTSFTKVNTYTGPTIVNAFGSGMSSVDPGLLLYSNGSLGNLDSSDLFINYTYPGNSVVIARAATLTGNIFAAPQPFENSQPALLYGYDLTLQGTVNAPLQAGIVRVTTPGSLSRPIFVSSNGIFEIGDGVSVDATVNLGFYPAGSVAYPNNSLRGTSGTTTVNGQVIIYGVETAYSDYNKLSHLDASSGKLTVKGTGTDYIDSSSQGRTAAGTVIPLSQCNTGILYSRNSLGYLRFGASLGAEVEIPARITNRPSPSTKGWVKHGRGVVRFLYPANTLYGNGYILQGTLEFTKAGYTPLTGVSGDGCNSLGTSLTIVYIGTISMNFGPVSIATLKYSGTETSASLNYLRRESGTSSYALDYSGIPATGVSCSFTPASDTTTTNTTLELVLTGATGDPYRAHLVGFSETAGKTTTIRKQGVGVWRLNPSSGNITGPTQVEEGTLEPGQQNALANSATTVVGGTLRTPKGTTAKGAATYKSLTFQGGNLWIGKP